MSIIRKEQVEEMYSNIEFENNDLGMSWIHKERRISPFNIYELQNQISTWIEVQKTGEYSFQTLECNKKTFQTDDGKTWYVIVVQQHRPDGEMIDLPMCSMSLLLFGFWVNGFVSAFKDELMRDLTFQYINNFNCFIEDLKKNPQKRPKTIAELMEEIWKEEAIMERRRKAKQQRKNKEEQNQLEAKQLEQATTKAEEAEAKLLADMKAEEDKKSSPKKKKEKKVKEAKVAVNPHKKEIRVSEGIWKPNPAWKKWEQENKRSASPP